MPKAVRFDGYGDIGVLHVAQVDRPGPGDEQILVRVKAAGLNPGEAAIRAGAFAERWPATFPSGQGSDFAGTVDAVGKKAAGFRPGDEVIGFTHGRASQAEYVLVTADQLVPKPPNVPWEQAGALFVAGTTAYAAVHAVGLKPGETLVVAGAAGGVGVIAVQLAKDIGAKVIGIASDAHHPWLRDHGVIPVVYGEGLSDRLRAATGGKIDAFVDTFGHGYVKLAVDLGVATQRINTIIDFAAAQKYHVQTAGNADAARKEVLAELAQMIAGGRLEIPIARTYPLDKVRDAYLELEQRHTLGKIVLVP